MAELSVQDKARIAAQLVEQSPPGEVNDVINGLRTIVGDDEALMEFVRPALRTYNLEQLTAVEHPATDDVPAHSSLLFEAAILPGTSGSSERYVDIQGKRSFAFDHITLAVSEYESYELPEEEETFRAELAKSLTAYTKNHFPSGSSSVTCSQYPLLPPAPPTPVVSQAKPVEPASEEIAKIEGPAEATAEKVVTDVVPEQLASGEEEPAPTPAAGESPKEEVDQPGGIEKLDEKVEEAKEEEEAEIKGDAGETTAENEQSEEVTAAETKPVPASDEPKVEEGETPLVAGTPQPTAPAVEERKQESIDNPVYTLEVVGNKYNTSNFWTGRWRTRWVVDQAAGTVEGKIHVDVHYYEQGNVQLATSHTASFPCPVQSNGTQSVASQIVTAIAKLETDYQLELNDVYDALGEKAFRALRRALPVTRQKMDWDKVGGYSLGSDLNKARA